MRCSNDSIVPRLHTIKTNNGNDTVQDEKYCMNASNAKVGLAKAPKHRKRKLSSSQKQITLFLNGNTKSIHDGRHNSMQQKDPKSREPITEPLKSKWNDSAVFETISMQRKQTTLLLQENALFLQKSCASNALNSNATAKMALDTAVSNDKCVAKHRFTTNRVRFFFPSIQIVCCSADMTDDLQTLSQIQKYRTNSWSLRQAKKTQRARLSTDCDRYASYFPSQTQSKIIDSFSKSLSYLWSSFLNPLLMQLSIEQTIQRISKASSENDTVKIEALLESLALTRERNHSKVDNLSLLDRYQPTQSRNLVGNTYQRKQLQLWLRMWRSRSHSDIAEDSDSERDESEQGFKLFDRKANIYLILGDTGAGKSSSVYACAQELKYHVIEINAGQHRSGKVIHDLAGEATQSTSMMAHPACESADSQDTLILFEDVSARC